MPGKEEIELFISEDGELKVHTKGVKGKRCLKVSELLSKELGKVSGLKLTPEYYESDKINNTSVRKSP